VDFDRDDDLQRGWVRRRTRGRADPPAHAVPSTEGYVQAVLAGLGWGMLSELQLAEPALRDAVVLLDPDAVVDVRLHWQRWKVRSPSLERLSEVVLAAGRQALLQGG
jgi:LysR family transcriptional regulator (chromosome initiation inhibitor)